MVKRKTTKPTKSTKKKSSDGASISPPSHFEGALAGLFGGGRGRGRRSDKADALYGAQQLMYSAWETGDPKRRIALARQALEISPDCADAYVLLAGHTSDLAEATRLNGLGVEAGMNALGPRAFEEDVGQFWGLLETRPYMRARLALAQCLWQAGDRDEAITHYRDMLRLNPGDNQGIRYILASCLLDEGRDTEVAALIDEYKDDASAAWAWSRALLEFRKDGDCEKAKAALAEATRANRHVPAYLTGKKKMPKRLPDMIGFGDESEAISYVGDYGSGWKNTPNAIEWAAGSPAIPRTVRTGANAPVKRRER
jgi:tetratricopeptide (TPR) repeat protein